MSQNKITLNYDLFLAGLKEGQANKLSLMTDENIKKTLSDFQKEMTQKRQEEVKAKAAKNLTEQERFLAANKKKKGVITLPSGLQYRVIKKGEKEIVLKQKIGSTCTMPVDY